MFKKIIKTLILLMFILLFFVSCAVKKTNQKIIKFACSYSSTDAGIRAIQLSLKKYEKMHPDIKIDYRWLTKDFNTKVLTMIASGDAPDIFRMNPSVVPTFIKKNALMALDDFIKNDKNFNIKDFFQETLKKYKYDGKTIGKGKIYGFGTDWSPDTTMFYNADLFQANGLKIPKKSMSWSKYVKVAKKITKRNGSNKIFGTIEPTFMMLVYQNGGKIFNKNRTKCVLDQPRSLEAINFLNKINRVYKVSPSQAESQDTDRTQLFLTKKIGMMFAGRYYASTLMRLIRNKFAWGVAPTLHKTGRKRVNVMLALLVG